MKYNLFSSSLLSLSSSSGDDIPAPMSLQPPHIGETFATVGALIEAVNEHALKQGFAVVKR